MLRPLQYLQRGFQGLLGFQVELKMPIFHDGDTVPLLMACTAEEAPGMVARPGPAKRLSSRSSACSSASCAAPVWLKDSARCAAARRAWGELPATSEAGKRGAIPDRVSLDAMLLAVTLPGEPAPPL